jgi:hypothetical protein
VADIFQADAFSGYAKRYEANRKPGPLIEAACWVRARRPFFLMANVRVIEHRRRRRRPAKRWIVAHIDPTSPGVGLALGQNRHSGVVTVQSLGGEDVSLVAADARRKAQGQTTPISPTFLRCRRRRASSVAAGLSPRTGAGSDRTSLVISTATNDGSSEASAHR